MTDDFFDATPELQTIRQWAHARYAAVWAVFYGVLLRVAASTGPEVQLPGVIGGRASLNLMCAFVSPSGGGKGISDKVARLAWPAPVIERPIGSGEGIAATFVPPKKEGIEPITRAIISVPEIDTLAGIASRQGSILLAQLKSAAMGEQLGQANSSEATTRIIPPHSYRMCLSVGAQPAHTGVLLDDTTGGTPQRFLWGLTIDPNMPADPIDDPESLNTRLPFWKPGNDGVVEIVYGPEHIKHTIIEAHIARQRGQEEALDGHAMLTRLKVAAALALLHHRIVVSELDWELSGVVMAESNRTRDWVVAQSKQAARAKVRERALSRAAGEEVIDERRLDVVKRRVRKVLSQGRTARRNLQSRMGKREYRELLDAALAEMIQEGEVMSIDVDRGAQFELTREFSAEPEFSTHNASSETLNHEFSAEPVLLDGGIHGAPGAAHQNACSEAVKPGSTAGHQDNAPKNLLHAVQSAEDTHLTARQWIENHVSGLLGAGTETVESLEVYTAGQRAGFKLDNLRQAAKKSDLIAVEAMRGGCAVWRLGSGGGNNVVHCEQWLTEFLSAGESGDSGRWVRAADVYAAGLEAGYGRDAVKSASRAATILKRGSSVSTEWCLDPSHRQESA